MDPLSANPSIAARLAERAALHPERLALAPPRGERLSYGGLAARVAALAAALERDGLGAGDRALLFVPMSAELYVVLIALLHLGATAVFVDAWADRRRLDDAVRAARPHAFLGSPRAQLLRLLSPGLRAVPISRVVTAGRVVAMARGVAPRPAAVVAPDHPALITFTTGSTGRPKAAARSHEFLWAQHLALAGHMGLAEDDVDMPTLPVFVLHNLASGVATVLPDFDPRRPGAIDPARVHAQMVRERVTTSTGSPAFYDRLIAWCESTGRRLPLRALFTGGAPVLPALARRLALAMPEGRAEVLYGSTEAEPIAAVGASEMIQAMAAPPGDSAPDGLCAGTPVRATTVRLIRPHDDPVELGPAGWSAWDVPAGATGEVVVTGAHVLTGYLDDPASDRANKIRDGARVWHRTGDAARLDAQGRLWLMGRVRERIERGGHTWWPLPAELRAMTVRGVSHAAYLGVRGAREQQATLVVEHARRTGAEFERRLREALAPWPVDRVVAMRRIPRDPRHASKTDVEAVRRRLF